MFLGRRRTTNMPRLGGLFSALFLFPVNPRHLLSTTYPIFSLSFGTCQRLRRSAGALGNLTNIRLDRTRHFQAYFLCFLALSPNAQFITFTLYFTTNPPKHHTGNVCLEPFEPSFTPVGQVRLMASPNAHFRPLKKG
jgi:hypothetical protein